VPREWSWSEIQRRGRITKADNKRTRWLLGEAARGVLRMRTNPQTFPLRVWGGTHCGPARHRRGRRRARSATRGILLALWRDGTIYEVDRLVQQTAA
jgi:hypothetical protein